MRIALAGNPNSGKTTTYNALTGRSEKVGNWAGVTVEAKEHPIKKRYAGTDGIIAVDLPGAYSMSPYTSEESITSEYVKNASPDVIINIVDATNLSRSLFFTTELLELGIPVVLALNKTDINERRDTEIDTGALSSLLGCPVIETVSTSSRGMRELVLAAMSAVGGGQRAPYHDKVKIVDGETSLLADKERFAFVDGIVASVERRKVDSHTINRQDKADNLLTNRWLGLPIFALVMLGVFWLSQAGPAVWLADKLTEVMELGQSALAAAIQGDAPALGIWGSILIDGIIGGFIAIVGFLPLVMIMYFLIALLEDCGYMARATVVLDPIFKRVGLSGKSVIPFIIGTGCAVPGVMACRAIRGERERRATAMLAPFMPCGAKLPVIALFAGAFFKNMPWVGALMYFVGILVIIFGALLVNLITGNPKKKNYFIIELPEYKFPSIPKAAISMCQRGWSYIAKAGTIILVCNFAVHLMQNFTWTFAIAEEGASNSILATIALPFAYLFAPIFGDVTWQFAAASITGFIAKENIVGTLAVSLGGEAAIAGAFASSTSALAFLMFNLFSPPCFAAIGAMNSEMKSKKWLFAGIGLQFAVGYSLGFLVNFFGTIFTGGSFGEMWWAPMLGWFIVAALAALLVFLVLRRNSQIKAEEAIRVEISDHIAA